MFVRTQDSDNELLTNGKLYEIIEEDGDIFKIYNDDGEISYIL